MESGNSKTLMLSVSCAKWLETVTQYVPRLTFSNGTQKIARGVLSALINMSLDPFFLQQMIVNHVVSRLIDSILVRFGRLDFSYTVVLPLVAVLINVIATVTHWFLFRIMRIRRLSWALSCCQMSAETQRERERSPKLAMLSKAITSGVYSSCLWTMTRNNRRKIHFPG